MNPTRRLLAIMFTDIEGYTGLMQTSEALAIEYRRQHREIFEAVTYNHQGTIVQYYGDGTLSFFESAVLAVQCAVEMQKRFLKETPIPVRIGIHMGDVVVTKDDIIGDAVNLASRVESLAVTGSVLVSDKVVEELQNHQGIKVKSMGPFHFKNDNKPRNIFAIIADGLVLPKRTQLKGKTINKNHTARSLILYAGGAWLFLQLFSYVISKLDWDPLLLDGMIILAFFGFTTTFILSKVKPRIGWPSFSLLTLNGVLAMLSLGSFVVNPSIMEPGKSVILNPFRHQNKYVDESLKSLAVLPFLNYTGDTAQDILYAGMHDALISEIGVLSAIRLTSHTSSMVYANSSKSLRSIAKELDVEAIIEASLTRIDSVVEFRIKLVDVFPQEEVLWSHEYHTALNDAPNMYKEVTKNIALKINGVIQPREEQLLAQVKTGKPGSYEAYLKGIYYAGLLTQEGLDEAEVYFRQAIKIDPDYALGYSGLSLVWMSRKQMGRVSPEVADPIIKSTIQKAMELDSLNPDNWVTAGAISTWTDFDWNEGEARFLRSIELNPRRVGARTTYSHLLLILNRIPEAQAQIDVAEAIDPLNPWVLSFGGVVYLSQGKVLSASKRFEMLRKLEPNHPMLNGYLLAKYTVYRQYDLAIEQLKIYAHSKGTNHDYSTVINDVYEEFGFMAAVKLVAEKLEEISESSYVAPTDIFRLYKLLENKEKRLILMQKMYDVRDPNLPYYAIRNENPMQKEPAYIKIMEALNLW